MLNRMRFASRSSAWARAIDKSTLHKTELPVIELVDTNDSRAVRNKDNVLGFYDLVINKKKSEECVANFISPAYIQHNPLIADGPVVLGQFFGQITRERAQARVVIHRII